MNIHRQPQAKPYLEKSCYGVYIGLFGGLILGAIFLGVWGYFQEIEPWSHETVGETVFLASAGGAGIGAITGAAVGLVVGFVVAAKMKEIRY